jgi:YD repeat-containing protein
VRGIVERDSETNELLKETACTYNDDKLLATKSYDAYRRVEDEGEVSYTQSSQTYVPIYENYPDHPMIGIRLEGKFDERVEKDGFGRVSAKTLKLLPSNQELFRNEYRYWMVHKAREDGNEADTVTADMVSQVAELINGDTVEVAWVYEYDRSGNISGIQANNQYLVKYYYDGLNRLVREDNYAVGKTYVWEYDVGGNITSKRTYALVTGTAVSTPEQACSCYEYSTGAWRDQLTSYDGYPITYDAMGNPTA